MLIFPGNSQDFWVLILFYLKTIKFPPNPQDPSLVHMYYWFVCRIYSAARPLSRFRREKANGSRMIRKYNVNDDNKMNGKSLESAGRDFFIRQLIDYHNKWIVSSRTLSRRLHVRSLSQYYRSDDDDERYAMGEIEWEWGEHFLTSPLFEHWSTRLSCFTIYPLRSHSSLFMSHNGSPRKYPNEK